MNSKMTKKLNVKWFNIKLLQVRKIFTYPQGGLGNLLKLDIKQAWFSKTDENNYESRDGNCYVKLCTTDKIKITFQNDNRLH